MFVNFKAIMKALEDARKQDPNVKVAEVTISKQETEDENWGRNDCHRLFLIRFYFKSYFIIVLLALRARTAAK